MNEKPTYRNLEGEKVEVDPNPPEPVVCTFCGEDLSDTDEIRYGTEGSRYEGEPFCEVCFTECDPEATVVFNGDPETQCLITAVENSTTMDGPFEFRTTYHRTDAWRGHIELESDQMSRLFDDAILSGHESEGMLAKLVERLRENLEKAGIQWAECYARSSNVFCTYLEVWVEKETVKLLAAHLILARIKKEVDYGNPLYTTGILIPRESLEKMKQLGFKVETDSDIMEIAKKGNLIEELTERMSKTPAGQA